MDKIRNKIQKHGRNKSLSKSQSQTLKFQSNLYWIKAQPQLTTRKLIIDYPTNVSQ